MRRGEGELERLWARWRGPLGLVWKQIARDARPDVADHPQHRGGEGRGAAPVLPRRRRSASKAQLETGDGSEFHALREFQTGMDHAHHRLEAVGPPRQAAGQGVPHRAQPPGDPRHRHRPADVRAAAAACRGSTGRSTPRCCWPMSALKTGDRVGALRLRRPAAAVFRRRCRARSAFPLLQRLAARLDYSTEETNYTLGLTQLRRGAGAALAGRGVHRLRRHHQRRADARERRRGCCKPPPGAVRDLPRRGAGGASAGAEPIDARGRLAGGHRRRAAARARAGDRPAGGGWACTCRRPGRRVWARRCSTPTSTSSAGICCEGAGRDASLS